MMMNIRIDVWRLEIALEHCRNHLERRMSVTASIFSYSFMKDQHPTQMNLMGLSS